jgi:hypothetical protein
MAYKLVALDIDGTIKAHLESISDHTLSVISMVQNAGVKVTLATGRMSGSALAIAKELDINSPIISSQGAMIVSPSNRKCIWHKPLTPKMALEALEALSDSQIEVLLYLKDNVYTTRDTPWVRSYGKRNLGKLYFTDDLRNLANKSPTRIVAFGDESEIAEISRCLNKFFINRLHVTRSLPHFYEILNPHAGKKNALEWLCNISQIRQDETVAFGNGYNDIEMVSWAGMGVAITESPPELLEVADVVAPPVNKNGLAVILSRLLDQNAFH